MSDATIIRKITNHSSSSFKICRPNGDGGEVTIDGYDVIGDVSLEIPVAQTPVQFQTSHLDLIDVDQVQQTTKVWVGGPGMLVRISSLPNYNFLSPAIDGNVHSGGERELIIDSPAAGDDLPRVVLSTLGKTDSFETPSECWMSCFADHIGAQALRAVRIPGARFAGSDSLPKGHRRQSAAVKHLFLAGVRFFEFTLALSVKGELVCAGNGDSLEGAQPFSTAAAALAELCEQYPGEIVVVALAASASLAPILGRDFGAEVTTALGTRLLTPSAAMPTCTKIWNAHKSIVAIDTTVQQRFQHALMHPRTMLTAISSAQPDTHAPDAGLWCLYHDRPGTVATAPAEDWIGIEVLGKTKQATNIFAFENVPTEGPGARQLAVLATLLNSGYSIAAFSRTHADTSTTLFIDDICRMKALRELRGTFAPGLGGFQAVYESPDGSEVAQPVRAGSSPGSSLIRLDEEESLLSVATESAASAVSMLTVETTLDRKETYGQHVDGQTPQVSKLAFVRGFCGLAGSSRVEALWPITNTKQ